MNMHVYLGIEYMGYMYVGLLGSKDIVWAVWFNFVDVVRLCYNITRSTWKHLLSSLLVFHSCKYAGVIETVEYGPITTTTVCTMTVTASIKKNNFGKLLVLKVSAGRSRANDVIVVQQFVTHDDGLGVALFISIFFFHLSTYTDNGILVKL